MIRLWPLGCEWEWYVQSLHHFLNTEFAKSPLSLPFPAAWNVGVFATPLHCIIEQRKPYPWLRSWDKAILTARATQVVTCFLPSPFNFAVSLLPPQLNIYPNTVTHQISGIYYGQFTQPHRSRTEDYEKKKVTALLKCRHTMFISIPLSSSLTPIKETSESSG